MQVGNIQYNYNQYGKQSFEGLKSIKYRGQFDPVANIKDAKTVKSFLDCVPIKNLCEKYDVKATFDAYSDRYYMDESHESLVMECKEILPTIKKSFKEKLMSLFTISNYVDKRVPLKVSFYGGNDCRENSTMSSLSDIIKGITDTEIERQLVTSERKLLLKKLNAIELKNAKRGIREYL